MAITARTPIISISENARWLLRGAQPPRLHWPAPSPASTPCEAGRDPLRSAQPEPKHRTSNAAEPQPTGARTSVRITPRTAQSDSSALAPRDNQALKRNKFRAPKLVAACENFVRKQPNPSQPQRTGARTSVRIRPRTAQSD